MHPPRPQGIVVRVLRVVRVVRIVRALRVVRVVRMVRNVVQTTDDLVKVPHNPVLPHLTSHSGQVRNPQYSLYSSSWYIY